MNKTKRLLEQIDHIEYKYKSSLIALGLPASEIFRKLPIEKEKPKLEEFVIVEKITESELKELHEYISLNDGSHVEYLDSLYKKYDLSRDRYRITVKYGEIQKLPK